MTEEIGPHIAAQVSELIEAGKVIAFGIDLADKQYDEIHWSQYGLIETNEIAVMVTCGSKRFAAKAKSRLIMPPMADRIWGIDMLDEALAFELGDKLWNIFENELAHEVELLRTKDNDS